MENYSYNSYAESGDSSPRSREIDFENPPPWDDAQLQNQNYKVKFMCSYGGKIHPRSHDNLLSYVGGETKIFAVDRNIKFNSMLSKLSTLCDADVTFKYQLPGEDLDALISVTNDDDLEHMMHEYDRLYRAPGKPARMRLFLFPANQSPSFGSEGSRSDRDRFVDVLNPGPSHGGGDAQKPTVPNKVDFLFGLEKGVSPPPPPPPVAVKLHDPVPEPVAPPLETGVRPGPGDRIAVSDPGLHPAEIQRQLQELHRLHISEQEQAAYRRKSEESLLGGYAGDYYVQKVMEKGPPANAQPTLQAPHGYWQEKQVSGGGFPATVTATPGAPDPPVYMIPAPGTVYHHTPQHPMVRPVTAPPNQGYYAVQRMASDVYREQPVYNVVQPPQQPQFSAAPSPTLPQQPPKMTGYPEGMGVVRPINAGGGVTLPADAGPFTQVAYDSTTGRQVYYTAAGGAVVVPPPYQGVPAAVSGEMRTGAVGPDGKLVAKVSQGSV